MKKLVVMLSAALLVLALAVPAAAAPTDQNKHLGMWSIYDCPPGVEGWTVVAKTVPGWDIEGGKGATPIHFRAGTFHVEDHGDVFDWDVFAPRGLEDKLVGPCKMVLVEDDPDFSVEVEDAYYVLPGNK
jgi:hypothetical protein